MLLADPICVVGLVVPVHHLYVIDGPVAAADSVMGLPSVIVCDGVTLVNCGVQIVTVSVVTLETQVPSIACAQYVVVAVGLTGEVTTVAAPRRGSVAYHVIVAFGSSTGADRLTGPELT